MTRHSTTRGQFGPLDFPAADNCPCYRPHGPRTSAEDLLREMAFVYHLTRSVKAAMTDQGVRATTRPE
jgi:hypothetical protein